MAIRPFSIAAMGVGLFAGSLLLGVAVQSCSTPATPTADAGSESGPCSDGTIQLLDCEGVDGAPAAEIFTDEACRALDDQEHRAPVTHDAQRAPTVTAPTEAQALPNTTAFTFTWRPGTVAVRPRVTPGSMAAVTPVGTSQGLLARGGTWLIPEAQAHCPPYSGVAYAVVFSAGGQEVLRAETSHLSYTPTAEAWTRLKAVRGVVSLRIEAVRFGGNAVSDGPYDQPTPRTFTITP